LSASLELMMTLCSITLRNSRMLPGQECFWKSVEEALAKSLIEIKQLKERPRDETDFLKAEMEVGQAHGEIIGRSQGIKRVLHQVRQVAPADCAVLITGETGTGKELIALEILWMHPLAPPVSFFLLERPACEVQPGFVQEITQLVRARHSEEDGGRVGHEPETGVALRGIYGLAVERVALRGIHGLAIELCQEPPWVPASLQKAPRLLH